MMGSGVRVPPSALHQSPVLRGFAVFGGDVEHRQLPLTWFEFASEAASDFDELVLRLCATEEWTYVEREVDIRLARDSNA